MIKKILIIAAVLAVIASAGILFLRLSQKVDDTDMLEVEYDD